MKTDVGHGTQYHFILKSDGQIYTLDENERQIYTRAISSLRCLWMIEDVYEVFLSAVFEIEQSLLSQSLRYQIFDGEESVGGLQISSELNSKLVTLLFSGRSYEEAARKMVEKSFPDFCDEFTSLFKNAAATSFEYRPMYALRNCMAHEHTAFIRITIGSIKQFSQKGNYKADSRDKYYIMPRVNIADLLRLEKLKSDVKPILRRMQLENSAIDMRPYWRMYSSKIADAHKVFRQRTKHRLDECLNIISEAERKYDAQNTGTFLYLIEDIEDENEKGQPFDRDHFEKIVRRQASVKHPQTSLGLLCQTR